MISRYTPPAAYNREVLWLRDGNNEGELWNRLMQDFIRWEEVFTEGLFFQKEEDSIE